MPKSMDLMDCMDKVFARKTGSEEGLLHFIKNKF